MGNKHTNLHSKSTNTSFNTLNFSVKTKYYIIAGSLSWLFTFVVGFFILAPSTDDGYYVIASLGTALKGIPGFWIGDEFAPSFFLPTAFTFVYGVLLKLTMILGLGFGPFGFRVYQFLFIIALPLFGLIALRQFFPRDYALRFLAFITLLSVTYFVQTAPVVRPEVLGSVLFIVHFTLRGKNLGRFNTATFVLALSGTMHPLFMILAFTVFGVEFARRLHLHGIGRISYWFERLATFAIPYAVLVLYYAFNMTAYREQIGGRAGILSNELLTPILFLWDNLLFWSDPAGIEIGLYSGYPAYAFVLIMATSTWLVVRNRASLWHDNLRWVAWPIISIQWLVFFTFPPFLPYMGFTSFLGTLVIVLLWSESDNRYLRGQQRTIIFMTACVSLSLLFIAFHSGKFMLSPEKRLTPAGLYSAMSPIFDDNQEAKFYTHAARLIPPLIEYFAIDDDEIRINFLYLDPDCLPATLLERANHHASMTLPDLDPNKTYWGLMSGPDIAGTTGGESILNDDGTLTFKTKDAHTTITLTPITNAYSDSKNLITTAAPISIELGAPGACE